MAGGFAVAADPSKYYTPYQRTGFGYSQAYVDSQNLERARQAQLMADQALQASITTSGMQAQAEAANTAAGNLANLSSNLGSITSPNLSGGSYSLPGIGGVSVGGGGTGGGGTGGAALSSSLQQQFDPWSAYRDDAASQLSGQMGQTSPSDIYTSKLAQMVNGQFTPDDPSYQWRFDQGQKAAERSLAAKGLLNSGNAAIELQQYGQGAASQEYGAQFDRLLKGLQGTESAYDAQMQRLMKLAGVDLDPTAGGQLAVQAQNANTNAAGVGVQGAKVAADYDLGMRELLLKQYLGQLSATTGSLGGMSGTNWSAIFGT
jgi:hypothetical protein